MARKPKTTSATTAAEIENSNIGALLGKPDLLASIQRHYPFLWACGYVHMQNSHKWPRYSWQLDPEHSNSTIADNLSAIGRHLLAYSMGKTIDPESGLPHIYHLACRTGMCVTAYYRKCNNNYKPDLDSDFQFGDNLHIENTFEELLFITRYDSIVARSRIGVVGHIVPRLLARFISLGRYADNINSELNGDLSFDFLNDTAGSELEHFLFDVLEVIDYHSSEIEVK